MKFAGLKWQHLLGLVLMIVLLLFPLWTHIYYLPLYYAFNGLLIVLGILRIKYEDRLDERFYQRWERRRQWGFWPNIALASVGSLVFMVAVVSLGQFFGNGFTPVDIAVQLQGTALVVLGLILLFFGILAGIAWWYEAEKRYNRIYYTRKYRA